MRSHAGKLCTHIRADDLTSQNLQEQHKIQMPGGDDTTDEAGLKRIADLTGGKAFRARDTDDLAGIYREIERIEPVDRPGEAVRPRVERYPWPLGAALACGLLAVAWPRRRRA